MKYRLTALLVFLSLALGACSLSEDITPPPGYRSPTPIHTLDLVTQTPQATRTTEPATVTPEASLTGTQLATQFADGTSNPGAAVGVFSGNLVNGSGGAIPEGQKIKLYGFDKDQSGSYQKALEIETPVDSNGSFILQRVEVPQGRAFLAITSLGGVEYSSDTVIVSNTTTDYSVPITIYEKTDDLNSLAFTQIHLIFGQPSQDAIQVTELFIVSNPSKQAVIVTSDGTSIPFIQTPENASGLQFQLSQGSAQLLNATGGFAMIPGADRQYGFIATYSLPYRSNLKFSQPFSLPVSSLTVLIPQGMHLKGEHLTNAGSQNIQSQTYQMYQASKMASGSSLSLTLSGKPGASTGFTLSRQTMLLIAIGVVGLLLTGLGIYLYFKDRSRLNKENEANGEEKEEDALGEDRDSIMDAIIALDDKYKAGEIQKESYEQRRIQLKERLKEVLSFTDPGS